MKHSAKTKFVNKVLRGKAESVDLEATPVVCISEIKMLDVTERDEQRNLFEL